MNENQLNTATIDAIVQRWTEKTVGLSEEGPRLPVGVILGEAIDVAEVIETYFHEQNSNGIITPGLAPYVSEGGLTKDTSTELRELQLAASTIDSRYYNLIQKDEGTTIEEADKLIRELRFALSFVLEDGTHPAGAEQLERLRTKEEENRSQDGAALVLDNYRELAREYIEELKQIPDFNPAIIDQAIATAQGLRQRSADAVSGKVAREQRELLALRNRFLTAIAMRLGEARRVIRYVFRDHPTIIKRATSDYARSAKRRTRRVSDVSEVANEAANEAAADPFENTQVPAGNVG